MKYTLALLASVFVLSFYSCEKVDNSLPIEPVQDSIRVVNGFDYFINATVDGSSLNMLNNIDNVGNGLIRTEIGPCSNGNSTRFTSYFGYVSDTARKELIAFGLTNCVNDSTNGFTDSTYVVGSFPIEIGNADTAVGFIYYMDMDSVLWTSSMGQNGLAAQVSHTFNVTEVQPSYDGIAALRVRGSLSAWVYNIDGDSIQINVSEFYTRAWKY